MSPHDIDKPRKTSRAKQQFALTSEDFMLRTKAPQQYAQAYTLVHFCMHGEGGRYRSGFLDYLRSAYQGLSSLTDFQNAIPVSGQEFEKRWNAYAASQSP